MGGESHRAGGVGGWRWKLWAGRIAEEEFGATWPGLDCSFRGYDPSDGRLWKCSVKRYMSTKYYALEKTYLVSLELEVDRLSNIKAGII